MILKALCCRVLIMHFISGTFAQSILEHAIYLMMEIEQESIVTREFVVQEYIPSFSPKPTPTNSCISSVWSQKGVKSV